jgi:hypothetical protein
MAIAQLSIDLVAQTAKFEAEMKRAADVVKRAADKMDKSFVGIGVAAGFGSSFGAAIKEAVTDLVTLVPNLVQGVARFQDLEEKTGASAQALASFSTAGDVAGVSADQLAGFMVKLTGTLSKTSEESKGAGPALKALGLGLEEFRKLAPEQQFQTLAERLATFKDGAGKTAIAIALLGKSGADALPFLKELAQSGLSQNRLTAEQIRLADEYADRQARVRSELRQAAQIAAIQALPAFTALTVELTNATRETLGLAGASIQLAGNNGVRQFAEGAALSVAVVAESLLGLAKLVRAIGGSFQAVAADVEFLVTAAGKFQVLNRGGLFNPEVRAELSTALEERNRVAAEANERYVQLFTDSGTKVSDALKFQFSAAGRLVAKFQQDTTELARRGRKVQAAGGAELDFRFTPPDAGTADKEAEQVRRAQLERALKDLESSFASEREVVQFQQQFLDAQRQNGLVSLQAYYERRGQIQQRALELELDRLADEKQAIEASLAVTKDPSERIKLQGRLDDVIAKASSVGQKSNDQAKLDALEADRAYQQAGERIIEFRAQVLELQGDLAQAAKLRADLAIDQARRSAATLGPQGASEDDLRRFEAATRAATALGDAQRNVQRISSDLATEEERVAIAARTSGASRSQVEAQLYALRQRALQQMAQELRVAEQLAASADPDSPTVQFARQLRLEFERLNEVIDPALVRLRQVGDEVADALGQAAGAITLNFKDAASAVKSLEQTLLQIGTRELVTEPLTDFFRQQIRGLIGAGQGGGIGGALGDIFGVRGGGVTAPAITSPTDAERSAIGALFEVSGPAADAAGDAALAASITASAATISATVTTSEATSSAAIVTAISTGSAAQVAAFSAAIAASTTAIVASIAASGASQALGGAIPWDLGFAAGGPIHGPGTATSDSIPILASAGEFMVRAHAAQQPGAAPFLARFNTVGMRAVEELLKRPRFADGGFIGASTPRLHRGYANGGSVWRGAVERMVQASAPGETTRNQHFDMRGLRVDSQGAMDRMAEDRAAIAITRKAQRRLARHLA